MVDADDLNRCRFTTARLAVGPWRALAEEHDLDLAVVVSAILTVATTRALPDQWRGTYDVARASGWIAERDAESPTLLVVDTASGTAAGLVMLHAMESGSGHIDVRIGYVFAESTWGRGLASELVAGLVAWARREPNIASLAGGVALDNPASARVLTKNGFAVLEENGDEELYAVDVG